MYTYNEYITLIQPCIASNGTETEERSYCFCAISSIGYNEFYRATQQGFSPELRFILPDYLEYNNQPLIEWNGKRYTVIRSYRSGQELELTCERVNA